MKKHKVRRLIMNNRIKELRESRNVSQEELATVLDTTQQSISLYESGNREPKLETWQQLADYFDVSVPYLQGFEMQTPNRLKELRQKKHLTLEELGNAVGMLNSTLSQYENGKRNPNNEVWQKLANYFEVSVSYIKGEIDTEQLEKLIELAIFFCFPKITFTYRNVELDDDRKSVIVVGILSQILNQLGYEPKGKFQEVYIRAVNLAENRITRNQLTDFKAVVDKLMPEFQGITNNLLQTYEKL